MAQELLDDLDGDSAPMKRGSKGLPKRMNRHLPRKLTVPEDPVQDPITSIPGQPLALSFTEECSNLASRILSARL